MGRPQGSKNKPKSTANSGATAASETPGPGHNSLSDVDLQALFGQHKQAYEKALAKKKTADAEFKNACKRAKAELGDEAVADIKTAIEIETEEGEAKVKARIELQLRVLRWMGLAIGVQADLFDDTIVPATDRAFAEGRRDGVAGNPRKTDHHPNTAQYRSYMDGYQVGQEALVRSKIRPAEPAAPSGDEEDVRPSFLKDCERETLGTEAATHTVQQ